MAIENVAPVSVSDDVVALQVRYGADFLSECARSLELRAATKAQALALYHRFYLRCSARIHSPVWIACGCLLLASKHAERTKKLRDIATCAHYTLVTRERWQATTPLDYYGAPGHAWKSSITQAENDILRACGFRVRSEIPHKLVLVFANTLREKAGATDWTGRWRSLMHAAWTAANDVMLVSACVTSRPDDVACACIARAASAAGVPLPSGWEIVFGATEVGVRAVNDALDELYSWSSEKEIVFSDVTDDGGIVTACGVSTSVIGATN